MLLQKEAKSNKSAFDDDGEITATTTDAAAARTIEMNREDARERVNMAAVERSFPPKNCELRLEDLQSGTRKHNPHWITKLFQGKRQCMLV